MACISVSIHAKQLPHRSPRLQSTVLASSYAVQDLTTGELVESKNSSEMRSIASITKLMTAIVTIDANVNLSTQVIVTHIPGISTKIPNNTTMSLYDLMHLALMSSDNLAAKTLALNYPGGEEYAIKSMNDKAKILGMHSTVFTDPTGLLETNESTANDLLKLVEIAENYPLIRTFSTSVFYSLRVNTKSKQTTIKFVSTNPLLTKTSQILVSKTGWIRKSGGCLVMLVQANGRKLAVALLNSTNTHTRLNDGVILTKLPTSLIK